MTRPEILFPLFAALDTLEGIGPKTAKALGPLGVERPKDFLFLLPHSGVDRSRKASIRDVLAPATVTVEVEVGLHLPPVDLDLTNPDAQLGERGVRILDGVGTLDQRLGRDTADVEAGPTNRSLLDHGNGQTQLSGSYRGRIPTRASQP